MNPVGALQHFWDTLIPHFSSPQKSAAEIQAIPGDNKIYVEDWDMSKGYLIVNIHYIWWPEDFKCFTKEFRPGDFEEYCKAEYLVVKSFTEWWACWSIRLQRIAIEKFIDAHKPMLQKELEEYYKKACIV